MAVDDGDASDDREREIVLLKRSGKVKALEDEILSKLFHMWFTFR